MLLLLFTAIMAPHFALGMLAAGLHLPIASRAILFCAALVLTLNARRLSRLAQRAGAHTSRKANQHTYEGIPCDELTSYLFDSRSFTTDAMSRLGLSQRKWRKIADALEHHGILTRGENNARVLAEISREELTRQLRDGFPLVFDPVGKAWVERRGGFDRWVLDKERREQREIDKVAKLERKEEGIRGRIKKLQAERSAFDTVLALAGNA